VTGGDFLFDSKCHGTLWIHCVLFLKEGLVDRCESCLDFVGLGHLLWANYLIEHIDVVGLFLLGRFELIILIIGLNRRHF
jgi:hypothetical protein